MSSFKIDDETRLKFNELLKESDASDNTEKIRQLKHSKKIKEDVEIYLNLNEYQILKQISLTILLTS